MQSKNNSIIKNASDLDKALFDDYVFKKTKKGAIRGGLIGSTFGTGLGIFAYTAGNVLSFGAEIVSETANCLLGTPIYRPSSGIPFFKTVSKFGFGGAVVCGGVGALLGAHKGRSMFEKKYPYLKIKSENALKEKETPVNKM